MATRPKLSLPVLLAAALVTSSAGCSCGDPEGPQGLDDPGGHDGGLPDASLPPDAGDAPRPDASVPAIVPTPVDPTTATSLFESTAFLYTGENPVQIGVDPGTIEPRRVVVLRGRTLDRDGTPLPGVEVTAAGHPELGRTFSREDGQVDFVANGGGTVDLVFRKAGYITAHRKVRTGWREFVTVPDVILIHADSKVTPLALDAPRLQVARGSRVVDRDGARQPTVVLPPGVRATLHTKDGPRELSTLSVRATEFTVGERGPKAMPSPLPPAIAYTYALELTADEADGEEGEITFDKPLLHYVENFLDFPVGSKVPVGYFDREKSRWVASKDGRVIQVLAVEEGLAVLDTDGDGAPDDEATLAAPEVTVEERQHLAGLYAPGQSLWRVPIPHFSPWDCNWPFGPPDDAEPPGTPEPAPPGNEEGGELKCGSIIDCQNGALIERIPLACTPFELRYSSVRHGTVPATLFIPLSDDSLPASVTRIDLEVHVAGRVFEKSFPAEPNQSFTYTWDGKDAYGRELVGTQPALVRVGYVYPGVYREPAGFEQSFGRLSGVPITGSETREEVVLWRETRTGLAAKWPDPAALGRWSINVHHVLDPISRMLLLGDGSSRSESSLQSLKIDTIARASDGLVMPFALAAAPDGSVFVLDFNVKSTSQRGSVVRRIAPDGAVSVYAGTGSNEFTGDGGPAIEAGLGTVQAIAVGPDGSLYLGGHTGVNSDCRIRRVRPDGVIEVVAGAETVKDGYRESCCSVEDGDWRPRCEDGLASEIVLGPVKALAVAPDGTLYFADPLGLRMLGTDGYVTRVEVVTDTYIQSLALAPDGSLYVGTFFGVSRLSPDGRYVRVAGHATEDYDGHVAGATEDGVPALTARMIDPVVAVAPNGALLIADYTDYDNPLVRIRLLTSDGLLTTVAGKPQYTSPVSPGTGDGGPATRALLQWDPTASFYLLPGGLAIDARGALYLSERDVARVRKVEAPWEGWGSHGAPSADGSEVYMFSPEGRHERTLDAVTGDVRWEFDYDADGRLSAIRDGDGNVTRIERDAAGRPTAIVSPFGLRTSLTAGDQGLARVTDPAGAAWVMEYDERGLLTGFVDPRGAEHRYRYDEQGRLLSDEGPLGSRSTLSRTEMPGGGYVASITTALGRTTEYRRTRSATATRLVTVAPGGEQTVVESGTDESQTTTYPDGVVVKVEMAADPRFGMVAPYVRVMTMTLPSGLVLRQESNRYAMLADPTDPLSVVRLTESVSVHGQGYQRQWSAAERTLTTLSPAGRSTIVEHDEMGRPTRISVPGLAPISVAYDEKGRLSSMRQGSGAAERAAHFSYGAEGALATFTDALGNEVAFTRDAAGRVIGQTLPGAGRSVVLARDAMGSLVGITPPSRPTHAFAYDALGQLVAYTPPGAGAAAVTYSYNADRQPTGFAVAGGGALTLSYNAAGQVETIAFPGRTIILAYGESDGRIASITATEGDTFTALAFGYDGLLLTGITLTGPIVGSVSRTYDAWLRLRSESVNGESPIWFSYDADGLLVQAGLLAVERSQDTPAVVKTALFSLTETRTYDAFGDIESVTFGGVVPNLYRVQVVRDALARVVARTETVLGESHTTTYVYDAAGRLAEVSVDGEVVSTHAYDDNGNRVSRTSSGVAVTGTYDEQDRMLAYGDATYAYSPEGTLISRTRGGEVTTYEYDLLGALRAVTLPDGRRIEYLLDPEQRRVGRKVDGVLEKGWIYGVGRSPLAEVDAAGQVVARFVYGTNKDVPDYMVRGGTTYRIIPDLLGSPRLVVDAVTGAVAQRMDYDELGRVIADTNPGFQPFGFAGGLYDPDTQLVRFGARDYDPETGRFTARDPVLFRGWQTNLYTYADGDPVNLIDPSGLGPGEALATPDFGVWDYFRMGWRATFGKWARNALDESEYGTYKAVKKVAGHLNTTIPQYRMMEERLRGLTNPNACDNAVDVMVEVRARQMEVIQDTADAAGRVYETAYSAAVGRGLGNPVDAAKDVAKDAAPGLLESIFAFFR